MKIKPLFSCSKKPYCPSYEMLSIKKKIKIKITEEEDVKKQGKKERKVTYLVIDGSFLH